MKKPVIVFFILLLILSLGFNVFMVNYIGQEKTKSIRSIVFGDANSRDTYFSMHNIARAYEVTKGKGIKVGILDTSFGYSKHSNLYAGGKDFADRENIFMNEEWHGYWMAVTLREIAPEVEIYALGVNFDNEDKKVESMIQAIEWAIENGLDVLTYSSSRLSEENEKKLDVAVNKANEHKIVTTFIHYPNPNNILPGGLFMSKGDIDYDGREPDLNIYHYDYNTVIISSYVNYMTASKDQRAQMVPPFMSLSSTSPVTAGFVALLKSIDNTLHPAEYKRILMETSNKRLYNGVICPRVPDIYEAVKLVGNVK